MFRPGDRVVLKGHWEFEDGIVGTIAAPPGGVVEVTGPEEWQNCRSVSPLKEGREFVYWVDFDEAHDDGSGDGLYRGASIDEDSLRHLDGSVKD